MSDIPVPVETVLEAIWYPERWQDLPSFCRESGHAHHGDWLLTKVELVEGDVVFTVAPRRGVVGP